MEPLPFQSCALERHRLQARARADGGFASAGDSLKSHGRQAKSLEPSRGEGACVWGQPRDVGTREMLGNWAQGGPLSEVASPGASVATLEENAFAFKLRWAHS